jgi:hypothetical protein
MAEKREMATKPEMIKKGSTGSTGSTGLSRALDPGWDVEGSTLKGVDEPSSTRPPGSQRSRSTGSAQEGLARPDP